MSGEEASDKAVPTNYGLRLQEIFDTWEGEVRWIECNRLLLLSGLKGCKNNEGKIFVGRLVV